MFLNEYLGEMYLFISLISLNLVLTTLRKQSKTVSCNFSYCNYDI